MKVLCWILPCRVSRSQHAGPGVKAFCFVKQYLCRCGGQCSCGITSRCLRSLFLYAAEMRKSRPHECFKFTSILSSGAKKLEQRSIFPGAMYGVSALVIHAVLLTIRNMAAMQRCFASPESIRSASPRSKHVKACREHPAGCTPEKGKAGVECLKIFGPGKARSKS